MTMTDGTCDICGRKAFVAVASSCLGPVSLAHCEECLNNDAEPTWVLDSTIYATGGNVHPAVEAINTYVDGKYVTFGDYKKNFYVDPDSVDNGEPK